jgi:hypothetical protein
MTYETRSFAKLVNHDRRRSPHGQTVHTASYEGDDPDLDEIDRAVRAYVDEVAQLGPFVTLNVAQIQEQNTDLPRLRVLVTIVTADPR